MEVLEIGTIELYLSVKPPTMLYNAQEVMRSAAKEANNPRLVETSEEVLDNIRAYCPAYMNDGLAAAALLSDVTRRAQSCVSTMDPGERGRYAHALYQFYDLETTPGEASASRPKNALSYIHSLGADCEKIELTARQYRENYENSDPTMVEAVRSNEDVAISAETWAQELHKICTPQQMLDVLKITNVEAVMIKAAKMLQLLTASLDTMSTVSDVHSLHRAHEADFFYAPLLEVLGLDEWAAALKDKARLLRLYKAGDTESVAIAVETTDYAESLKSEIVDKLLPGAVFATVHGKVGAYSRMGELDGVDLGEVKPLKVQHRTKSYGSMAYKLAEYRRKLFPKEAIPSDAIGLNIITNTWEDAANALRQIYEQAMIIEGMELSDSPTNGQGHSILFSAPEEISAVLKNSMDDTGVRVNGRQTEAKGYKTFKIYLNYKGVSIEVQCLTSDAHDANRFGEGAHGFKSAEDLGDEVRAKQAEQTREVHGRMGRLAVHGGGNGAEYEINGQSLENSYYSFATNIDNGYRHANKTEHVEKYQQRIVSST